MIDDLDSVIGIWFEYFDRSFELISTSEDSMTLMGMELDDTAVITIDCGALREVIYFDDMNLLSSHGLLVDIDDEE